MKPVVIFTLEDVANATPKVHVQASKNHKSGTFKAILAAANILFLAVKLVFDSILWLIKTVTLTIVFLVSKSTKIVQNYTRNHGPHFLRFVEERKWGLAFLAIAIGALVQAISPIIKIEAKYYWSKTKASLNNKTAVTPPVIAAPNNAVQPQPTPEPNPLTALDGSIIVPKSTDFAIIIPKLGINTAVIAGVNPGNEKEYLAALKNGVAHAVTSFYPSQNGSVYLFSHSTNYQWFVKDLNAVFYLLKNLEAKDTIVVVFKQKLYIYSVREQQIVEPKNANLIYGTPGKRELILQTCWPPGTVFNRLLIFADLIEVKDL